jgi:outer membrane protein TolC
LALLDGFSEIASSRYATGTGPQQAVLRAEVELSRVQEQLISIEQRVRSMRIELNTLADRPPMALLALPRLSEISAPLIEHDTEVLIASAEAIRPEMEVLRHRLARQAHERELAQSRARPEMMIGANWIAVGQRPDGVDLKGEGDDAYNVVVGATIPIWTRAYRAAVAEVDLATEATNLRLADMENRIAQEIHQALLRVDEALDLMELQATALIPQAEQTLAATEAAFRTGQTTMLDLIDAERVLLRLRSSHERSRRNHLLALADLERAVGAALVEVK